MIELVGALGGVFVVAIILGAMSLKNLIHLSGPNEVLIFSGRSRTGTAGQKQGYRLIKGGRGWRVPLIETVDRMDLTNMVIDVSVGDAYSLGGIPLNVQAVANVKVAGDAPQIHNALERLLGKPRELIMQIAKETLEGNLRGVLATLTPEQVNEDKMAFAQSMIEEAEHDLSQLGLILDTLKIQNVTDDQGYLHAIGRKQSAELQKSARIAEAEAKATAVITAANNEQQTALAQIQAQTQVAKAEADRRVIDAQTKRGAFIAEQESEVQALVAKSEAEVEVQRARIEQMQMKLAAEVIEPASARRDQMIYGAQGDAARVLEDGRARAEAIQQLAEIWNEQGDGAKKVLMLQQMERLADILAGTVKPMNLANVSVINQGGNNDLPVKLISAVEQIRSAPGGDRSDVVKNRPGLPPKPPAKSKA